MYYEQESGGTSFLTGLLVGALLGASVALLTAPQKGSTVRARLIERVRPPEEPTRRDLATRQRYSVRR